MATRTSLTLTLSVLLPAFAFCQDISYPQADSVSLSLYNREKWTELHEYGRQAIASGTDFPMLRLRMARANFMTGNYAAALAMSRTVLREDSYNSVAHDYAYWSNLYLNRPELAGYHAAYLDSGTRASEHITAPQLLNIQLESGIKLPGISSRGVGSYSRAGLSARLGWRWTTTQAIAVFAQTVHPEAIAGAVSTGALSVRQLEYFGKFTYAVRASTLLFGGIRLFQSEFGTETHQNMLGIAGVRRYGDRVVAELGGSAGTVSGKAVRQANAQLSLYPLGNTDLYLVGRVALLANEGEQQFIVQPTLGGKIVRVLWADAGVVLGRQNNYADADGLYLFNSLDITTFKSSANLYVQVRPKVLFTMSYALERKDDFYQITSYHQHSLTAGITWKY